MKAVFPGLHSGTLNMLKKISHLSPDLDYNLKMIAFDAQTSGGLLMCVPPERLLKIFWKIFIMQDLLIQQLLERLLKKREIYLSE